MRKIRIETASYWWAATALDLHGWRVVQYEPAPKPLRGMPEDVALLTVCSPAGVFQVIRREVYCRNEVALEVRESGGRKGRSPLISASDGLPGTTATRLGPLRH